MVRKQQGGPRSHLQAGGQEMPAREVLSWRRSLVFSLEPASEGNILEEVEMVLLTVQRAQWTEVKRRGEQGAGAGAAESLVSVRPGQEG